MSGLGGSYKPCLDPWIQRSFVEVGGEGGAPPPAPAPLLRRAPRQPPRRPHAPALPLLPCSLFPWAVRLALRGGWWHRRTTFARQTASRPSLWPSGRGAPLSRFQSPPSLASSIGVGMLGGPPSGLAPRPALPPLPRPLHPVRRTLPPSGPGLTTARPLSETDWAQLYVVSFSAFHPGDVSLSRSAV